ncbi:MULTISPECIES: OST-HTH/LOTUS domain-containing protein [unclassified Acinetobacter]|jgi:hypothetical protein|uniref:OST-HTH/LOTUS domain-containing protein n=1 Tax=unclassified Acinetobacter TaxID=196816 RepID=UPI000A33F381|nr:MULTISPECIES: OST-HTH/LOTUS domain-containing protein [unclassified Acinetobacter]OTG74214.1 hypothetical protein B9T38_02400 [Acinetobacter sp. ANC 4218]QQN39745.1 hypothetical protein JFY49_01980 [Acinetobacter sp. CS-2]
MQNIEEIRERIYSLLGKHLIRFQTIEMRLKTLMKINKTIISKPNNSPLVIEPSVQNQTLGGLSTKALNSLFLVNPLEEDTIITEPNNTLRLDMKISFNLCEHNHQRLNSQFQEFVTDRNFIAHHFQEKYNLSNLDESKEAVDFLLNLEKKHKPFLDQFEQYCLNAQKSLETQIDFLKSDLFKARFIFPSDEIYKEIEKLIINNKKNDGWISLTTVGVSINKKFPNANKKIKTEYGFKNLNDLLLNSGLFLLKIEPTSKGEKMLIQINYDEAIFEVIEN